MPTPTTALYDGKSPEQALQAFCLTYSQEETQDALWQCLQPRLLQLASQAPDEEAYRQLALHSHLEELINAVYQLPTPKVGPG